LLRSSDYFRAGGVTTVVTIMTITRAANKESFTAPADLPTARRNQADLAPGHHPQADRFRLGTGQVLLAEHRTTTRQMQVKTKKRSADHLPAAHTTLVHRLDDKTGAGCVASLQHCTHLNRPAMRAMMQPGAIWN
jgi:hypothetical protein